MQAKIFAESEETQELYTLIASSDSINVEEVEETLIRTGQYNALLKIYMKLGRREKLLEIWSKYASFCFAHKFLNFNIDWWMANGQMTTFETL